MMPESKSLQSYGCRGISFVYGLFLVYGISVANLIRGYQEILFYLVLLFVVIFKRASIPHVFIIMLLLGVAVLLNPLFRDVQFGTIIYFVAPFIQGYLIANFLYHVLGCKTQPSLQGGIFFFILIQAAFVLYLFVFPEVRQSLLLFTYIDDIGLGDAFSRAFVFRGYGLTRHHLYGFSLAVALLASVFLYSRTNGYVSKLVVVVLALVLMALNARIGLFVFVMTFCLFVFHKKQGAYLLVSLILIGIVAFLNFGVGLNDDSVKFFNWLGDAFTVFSSTEQNATTDDLKSMIYFPSSSYSLVFGTGLAPNPGEANYSDIGVIRGIYEGGCVFILIVIGLYFSAYVEIIKSFNHAKWSSSFIFIIGVFFAGFIMALVKGSAYSISDFSRAVFVLAFTSRFIARSS